MFQKAGNIAGIILLMGIASGVFASVPPVSDPDRGEWDFKLREIWAKEEVGGELLTRISGIKMAADGTIYAVEPKRFRFLILNPEGDLLKAVGQKGEGPGEFRMIWDVQLAPNRVVVPGMSRVHMFDRSGKFLESPALPSGIFPVSWVDESSFLAVGSLEEEEDKFEILKLYSLKTHSSRDLTKVRAGKVMKASSGGMRLRIRDVRTNPSVIVGYSGKMIYYGFSGAYKIHSMNLDGQPGVTLSLEGRRRHSISMAAKRRRFEKVILNGAPMPKEMVDQMVKQIPDHCTFFYRIQCDEAGRVWVFVTDMENQSGREVDIFSAQGRYVWHGEIRLPDGMRFAAEPEIQGGNMVAWVEDDEGDRRLVKYAVSLPGR